MRDVGLVVVICPWSGRCLRGSVTAYGTAAKDESVDGVVNQSGLRPGDTDLAGTDARHWPVDDIRALVEAGGRLGSEADALAVGDRVEPFIGVVHDRADSHRV